METEGGRARRLQTLPRALSDPDAASNLSKHGSFCRYWFWPVQTVKNLIGLLCSVLPCLSAISQLALLTWPVSRSLAPRLIKLLSSSEDVSTHSFFFFFNPLFLKRSPVKNCFFVWRLAWLRWGLRQGLSIPDSLLLGKMKQMKNIEGDFVGPMMSRMDSQVALLYFWKILTK